MLHSSPFTRFRMLSEINLSGLKSQIGHRLEKIYAMSVFFEKIVTTYLNYSANDPDASLQGYI